MVIGRGLIAKRFHEYIDSEDFLVFASGVSNSKCTDQLEFDREFELLVEVAQKNSDKVLIYFSTCSVEDPEESKSAYVEHKRKIERFIASASERYLIFRVSNLVGKADNPNTVLNFIVNKVQSGERFNLWANADRNLIDVDDFFIVADYILKNSMFRNQIVNIANSQNYHVTEIVHAAEKYFNKKANYTLLSKGSSFKIDISAIQPIFPKVGINFDDKYLERLFSKYYLH